MAENEVLVCFTPCSPPFLPSSEGGNGPKRNEGHTKPSAPLPSLWDFSPFCGRLITSWSDNRSIILTWNESPPSPIQATIYGFCRGECIPAMLYNVSYYMCYLNSSLNPFAYALGKFKKKGRGPIMYFSIF